LFGFVSDTANQIEQLFGFVSDTSSQAGLVIKRSFNYLLVSPDELAVGDALTHVITFTPAFAVCRGGIIYNRSFRKEPKSRIFQTRCDLI
jgi:hypothetical protein